MSDTLHARCNNNEANVLGSSMLSTTAKTPITDDAYLNQISNDLELANKKLTHAIKEEKVNSKLNNLDDKRDLATRVIWYEAKAKLFWPDDEIMRNAQLIWAQLAKYKGLPKLSYLNQSAETNALLADFEKPELQEAFKVLPQFTQLIKNLKLNQVAFENEYLQSVANKQVDAQSESATALKDLVRKIINTDLLPYLGAMARSKPAIYGAIYSTVVALTNDMNKQIKQRLKKGKSPDSESED